MNFYLFIPVIQGMTPMQQLEHFAGLFGEEFNAQLLFNDWNEKPEDNATISKFEVKLSNGHTADFTAIYSIGFGSDERLFLRLRLDTRSQFFTKQLIAMVTEQDGYYGDNSKHFYQPSTGNHVWNVPEEKTDIPYSLGEVLRKIATFQPDYPLLDVPGNQIDKDKVLRDYNELRVKHPDLLPLKTDKNWGFLLTVN